MKLRVFLILFAFLLLNSCQFFTADKNKNVQELDTIVDFSSVDASPTFEECKSLIDKIAQTNCFRNTIQQKIADKLATFSV